MGFALAPRLGMNLLLGRSGILTPALFFNYTAGGTSQVGNRVLLEVAPSYGLQIGYTVML